MEKKRYSDRVRYIKISLAPYFSGEEPTFKQFTEFNTTFLQGAILCLFLCYLWRKPKVQILVLLEETPIFAVEPLMLMKAAEKLYICRSMMWNRDIFCPCSPIQGYFFVPECHLGHSIQNFTSPVLFSDCCGIRLTMYLANLTNQVNKSAVKALEAISLYDTSASQWSLQVNKDKLLYFFYLPLKGIKK